MSKKSGEEGFIKYYLLTMLTFVVALFPPLKEREAALEEAPPVSPIIVQDTGKVDTLTAEVESLKTLLQNQKQEVEAAKKSLIEADARNAELMKKFEDAEKRAEHLQESTQRLEEKLSNIESENQVLRQQALTMSPTGKSLSARPRTMIFQRTPENGKDHNGEARVAATPETALALPNSREPESEEKPQKSLNEKQQENQAGSRWLVANGMGKKNKHPLMKSKAADKSSGSFWSISSKGKGSVNKVSNVIILNETLKLLSRASFV